MEIIFDTSYNSIDDFMKLNSFTESKYSVSDYYHLDKSFVEKYFNIFPEQVIFGKAIFDGKIICIAMILMGEDIAHYHFGASDPNYTSLQGNSLLFYRAALYAAQKGKKLFDLGGVKTGRSLEKYKEGMSQRYISYLGTKIRNKVVYDSLVEQVGGPRANYFPAYRRD